MRKREPIKDANEHGLSAIESTLVLVRDAKLVPVVQATATQRTSRSERNQIYKITAHDLLPATNLPARDFWDDAEGNKFVDRCAEEAENFQEL